MASTNTKTFEQLGATLLTGLIIKGIAKGDPTKTVKAANTALAVATAVTAIGNGDPVSGVAALSAIMSNSDMDPAVGLAVHGLFGLGAQQLALVSTINKALPFFGSTAEAIAVNIAQGVTDAANAEMSKLSGSSTVTPTPTPTQSS